MGAIPLLLAVAQAIPAMVEAGHTVASVVALWNQTGATVKAAQAEGRDPTPAEWDALKAVIDADVAIIDAG